MIDPILRNVRQYTLFFSGMAAGDRVLDVCYGTGAKVIEYGRSEIIAVGIDTDQNILGMALRSKVKLPSLNMSFCLADATNLPFNDHYFDYVSISFGLHDKELGAKE